MHNEKKYENRNSISSNSKTIGKAAIEKKQVNDTKEVDVYSG